MYGPQYKFGYSACLRKSHKAKDFLKRCQAFHDMPILNVIQECCTHWNSALDMVKRMIRLKDIINKCFNFLKKKLISDEQFDIMQEIVKCFEPFSQATNLLSGQEYPTSSLIKVVNQDLENNCEEIANDSGIIKEMKILMRQKLATRNVRKCAQTLINVSCILDPRFKQVIDHSDKSIIELVDKVVELHNMRLSSVSYIMKRASYHQ